MKTGDEGSSSTRTGQTRSRRVTALMASFGGAVVAIACGGGGPKAPVGISRGDAGAEAAVSPFATSPPPSGLPPMASMPPPGVAGSKRAKTRPAPGLVACSGATRPQGKDPVDLVKRIGDGCAAHSKMKPVGALMRGQQSDREMHQENK